MEINWKAIVNITMWVSVAFVIGVTAWATENAHALWFLVLPAVVTIGTSSGKGEDDDAQTECNRRNQESIK